MTVRDGYIIPNVSGVLGNSLVAEPDQGDFLILGNARFGVITGCKIELSGGSVQIESGPNRCIVNGNLFTITGGLSRSLTAAEAYARFDLVVYDTQDSRGLYVLVGTASVNPVWPDITNTMVVLAEVYTPASGSAGTRLITDKRNILASGVYGYGVDKVLVSLDNFGVEEFSIAGDGTLSWTETISLSKTGSAQLTLDGDLVVTELNATTSITLAGVDVVTTDTIERSGSAPSTPGIGKVWTDADSGVVSVWNGSAWVPINAIPVGTIIQTIIPPSSIGAGWLPLDGGTYTVGTGTGNCSSTLFSLGAAQGWVAGPFLTLPNWNRSGIGDQFGPATTSVGTETTISDSYQVAVQGRGNQLLITQADFRLYSYIRN